MKLRLLKFLTILAIAPALSLSLSPSAQVLADCSGSPADAIQCGANAASQEKTNPAQAQTKVHDTIVNIINLLSAIIGFVAVVVIIVGGFRYITSGGNEQGTKSARETIIYALIGLVVVALAQILVKFVLQNI